MPTLAVTNLSAGYRRRPVLRGLTLEAIEGGRITALVGPNGAGKSTLLRALAGFVSATGSARLSDLELVGAAPDVRGRHVSFMPQSMPHRVGLTVFESVLSALKASPLGDLSHDDRSIERRALDVLERVGITDLALEPLDQMSGGQRQLASLAQAIVRDPKLLLLDEPTSSLDLGHQVTVMALAQSLAREGRIVIVVLHDLSLAARWSERIVVMHRGAVDADDAPSKALSPTVIARVYGVSARVEPCSRGSLQVLVDGLAPHV